MGKRNTKLTGPDFKLDKEQFTILNKEFYEGFLDEFYTVKVINLLSLITNSKKFINDISKRPIEIEKLQLVPNGQPIEDQSIIKYAKVELAMTYFHCLETFIRLFIAHSRFSGCPWLDLARLSIKKYKEELNKISEGKFNHLNQQYNEDETILYVFTGRRKPDNTITKEFIEGYKNWLSFAASQLLETYDYNSFKHGLAVTPSQNGLTISKQDETPLFEVYGEVIEHLTRMRQGDRQIWAKQINFVKYDKKATFILILEKMMKSILDVGRADYLRNGHKEVIIFKAHELLPKDILIDDENGEIHMDRYLKGLLYFE
ncbi:hypothetical protein ABEQ76_18325 [Bacillus velezensis]|nr:hypothetical protein P5666_00520 [Bacillus subtilis]